MNIKYFCAPKLREFLNTVTTNDFKFLDIDELRPLAIRTTYSGLAFDFNCGLRLQIPEGNWHVKILDYDSEIICFEENVSDVLLISLEKFFVRWAFALWLDGQFVFAHTFDPEERRVHFHFLPSGMGDKISLFPYVEGFRKKWGCKVSCTVEPYLQEIINLYFPEVECCPVPNDSYATFYPAPGFNPCFTPEEIRKVPMEKFGQQIFGLSCAEKIVYHPTKPRQIPELYVCIAVQASSTLKTWLYPDGWKDVINYLKRLGYRVLCIDKNREQTNSGVTVKMPEGAEDFTGDLPLSERVNLLAYADFFICTSSGLSWLAWATNVPVILISGISSSWFEFSTPYRVINRLVCFGCMNDATIKLEERRNCPHHIGTDRAYECSKKISTRQVTQTIDQLLADKRAGRFSYPKFL